MSHGLFAKVSYLLRTFLRIEMHDDRANTLTRFSQTLNSSRDRYVDRACNGRVHLTT